MNSNSNWPHWLLGLLITTASWTGLGQALSGPGSEVLIIYNSSSTNSKAVAEHYAERRRVPGNQMLGLELPEKDGLSRTEYRELIQEPLLRELPKRQLASWSSELVPMDKDHAGSVRYKLNWAKFRYIVLCYGVPWIIVNDPLIHEPGMEQVPGPLRHNDASVDSDLALLPSLGRVPLTSAIPNPWQKATNASVMQPGNGVFMVTRLDGPTPELASALVDKAMEAEKNGLWGNAFFDLRGIPSGEYILGDQFITNAAAISRRHGYETYIDNAESLFPPEYPLNQVAIYMGWYSQNPAGALAAPTIEFMPGAIAYHLHSFSGTYLHSSAAGWVGPLIAKGATVTLGCVLEPYLAMTPDVGILMDRLANRGFTFGEAALACQPTLSWMTIAVGDPLYRPFGRSLLDQATELELSHSPLAGWAYTRQINVNFQAGQPLDKLIEILSKAPGLKTNAVLSEKLARLFAEKGRLHNSIEWMQRAVAANCTPQEKTRDLLELAGWQETFDEPKAAYESLEALVAARPDYPAMLDLRKRERTDARQANLKKEVARLEAEIERLTPPPPPPAKAAGNP